MPLSTWVFYCIVLASGVALASYIVWWRDSWFDAFLAAVATACVLVPIFVRREFRFVRDLEADARLDLQAARYAGDEMLRLMREQSQAEKERWSNEYMRLVVENRDLKGKLAPFKPELHPRNQEGKFIAVRSKPSRRPSPPLIEG